ncbi:MAG: hypothetical protein IJW45_07325 [Oscillospiraceae bacterium]|nr:hypothetical protein [Oscillospiraceae bacterium]
MLFDKYADGGWVLAIRPRISGRELFLGHTQQPFKLIKNPWRYWCADPFLVHHQGVRYIFCEAFDILKDRGILAYRTIDEKGRISRLRPCLDTGSHLSYPNVFFHEGQVYMIPESGTIDEVALYRASRFPDRWEKEAVLLHDAACDTDLIEHQGKVYLLTLIFDKTQKPYVYDKLYAYVWDGTRFTLCQPGPVVQGARYARNAGCIFPHEGTLYRVSQDCKDMYGERITFHQILELSENSYKEHAVRQIDVADIKIDSRKHFDGIHTYNADDCYEIVDLQRKKWLRIERLLYLFTHKLRHVLKISR